MGKEKGKQFRVVDTDQDAEIVAKQLNKYADAGYMIALHISGKVIMVPMPQMESVLPEGTFAVPGA